MKVICRGCKHQSTESQQEPCKACIKSKDDINYTPLDTKK
jgi:hypothetical protein